MNKLGGTDMDREPVGIYGRMWMQNMEKHYPEKVEEMIARGNYHEVARSVNKIAKEYQEQLSDQYDKHNPRPHTTDYNILLEWTTQKKYQIDHLVMTEVVLGPVTTP